MLRIAPLHLLCLLLLGWAFSGIVGIPLPIEQTRIRSGPLFLPENFAINSGGQAFGNFVKEEWPWITGRTSSFSVDDDFPIGGKFMNGERQAYISHRYGLQGASWGYNLPIATPGVYDCALHFAETHSPNFDADKRVFDATIQNQTQESIDVMKELNGAEFTALVRRWRGLKVYGWLEVRFEARKGDAFLAAITCAKTADFVDQADSDKVKEVEDQLFSGEIVLGIGSMEVDENLPESDSSPSAIPDDPCGFFPEPPPLIDTPVMQPSVSPSILPDGTAPDNIGFLPELPEPAEPQITDEAMPMESPEITEEAMPTELPEITEEPMVTEEPDEPEGPEEPDVPEGPEEPDVPEGPEEPDVPEGPEEPDVPEEPEEPDAPEEPEEPDAPEEPEEPDAPEEPEEPDAPEGPEQIPSADPQPEAGAEEFLQPFELHVSNLGSFTETLKEELKEHSAESTGTMPSKWAMTKIEPADTPGAFIVDMVVTLNNDDGQQKYDAYIEFIQDGNMNKTLQRSFPEANVTLLSLPEFARSETEPRRSDSQSASVNVGAIVGGALGGLLVILAFAIMLLGPGLKRRLDGRTREDYDSPPPVNVPASGTESASRSFGKRNTSGIHSMEIFEDDSTFTAAASRIEPHVEPVDLLHLDTERDMWGRGTNL